MPSPIEVWIAEDPVNRDSWIDWTWGPTLLKRAIYRQTKDGKKYCVEYVDPSDPVEVVMKAIQIVDTRFAPSEREHDPTD